MTHHACVCVSVWTHCRCCSSTVEVRLCVLAGGGRGRWIAADATENCLINIFISCFHPASVCEPGLSSWAQRHRQQIPSCTAAKMSPSRAGRALSQAKEKSRSTHPSKPTRCSYCVHHATNHPSITCKAYTDDHIQEQPTFTVHIVSYMVPVSGWSCFHSSWHRFKIPHRGWSQGGCRFVGCVHDAIWAQKSYLRSQFEVIWSLWRRMLSSRKQPSGDGEQQYWQTGCGL